VALKSANSTNAFDGQTERGPGLVVATPNGFVIELIWISEPGSLFKVECVEALAFHGQ
jgi:hypothetical protein